MERTANFESITLIIALIMFAIHLPISECHVFMLVKLFLTDI